MACRGSGVQIPSAPRCIMKYFKSIYKFIFETKTLVLSQFLIATLSLIQASIVARELGPSKFGQAALVLTLPAIVFRSIHSRSSDFTLVALRDLKITKQHIIVSSLLIDLFSGMIASIISIAVSIPFAMYFGMEDMGSVYRIFLVYICCRPFLGLSETVKGVLTYEKKLNLFAVVEFISVIIRFVAIILLVSKSPTIEMFILGHSIYAFSYGLLSVGVIFSRINHNFFDIPFLKNFYKVAKHSRKFLLTLRFDQIVGMIPNHFDLIIINIFGGYEAVGIYNISKRLLMPINYLVVALTPWIQSEFVKKKSQIRKIGYKLTNTILFPLSVLILFAVYFFGPWIIEFTVGIKYQESYVPWLVMTVGYLVFLLFFWVRQALLLTDRLIYHAYSRILNTGVFLVGSIYFSRGSPLLGVAIAYVLGMSLQKMYELYIFEKKSA